jgi:MoaA/NifB/PqqE/SkfB family radical SAM enzyme
MSAITWCKLLLNPELFRVRPRLIRPIVTRNCPLTCAMCTFWKQKTVDPSLTLVKHWIYEAREFGAIDCSLGGGEPPLRQDICEIVHEVKNEGMSCGMTTSGWFINDWKSGKREFPAELDRIDLSIDGITAETHDKIRCKGSWKRAMDTLDWVLDNELCDIPQINFVLHPLNFKELVPFCEQMKGRGLKVSLIPLCTKLAAQESVEAAVPKFDDLWELQQAVWTAYDVGNIITPRAYMELVFQKMDCLKENPTAKLHQSCLAPYIGLLIFADAGVYPCGVFDYPMGYLTEDKHLNEIWNDAEFKTTRRALRLGNHEFCGGCHYVDILPNKFHYHSQVFLERRVE